MEQTETFQDVNFISNSSVSLGRLFLLVVSQFSHLQSGDYNMALQSCSAC
jgi:hypothetical protein